MTHREAMAEHDEVVVNDTTIKLHIIITSGEQIITKDTEDKPRGASEGAFESLLQTLKWHFKTFGIYPQTGTILQYHYKIESVNVVEDYVAFVFKLY